MNRALAHKGALCYLSVFLTARIMKKALFISLCALLLMSIGCKKGSVTPTPQIISVTSVTLSAQSLTLEVGGSEQLTATVLPANADNKAVSWSSSNQAVATVADGLVTAVKKGSATLTVKTADGGKTATCAVTVENPKVVAIDLGLSVKWADRNIGAETPEEYGDYFAWGETSPKEIYPWDNYKFWDGTNVTKYTASDHLFVMDEVDDVAHKVLGGKWRMPTAGEWEELRNEMNWQTVQNGVKGKAGNGNELFLPFAGMYSSDGGASLYLEGQEGFYWTSSICEDAPSCAYFAMYPGGLAVYTQSRCYGLTVRAVSE